MAPITLNGYVTQLRPVRLWSCQQRAGGGALRCECHRRRHQGHRRRPHELVLRIGAQVRLRRDRVRRAAPAGAAGSRDALLHPADGDLSSLLPLVCCQDKALQRRSADLCCCRRRGCLVVVVVVVQDAGLFDPVHSQTYTKIPFDTINNEAAQASMLEAAVQSLVPHHTTSVMRGEMISVASRCACVAGQVLVKNGNTKPLLPLKKGLNIALIGPHTQTQKDLAGNYFVRDRLLFNRGTCVSVCGSHEHGGCGHHTDDHSLVITVASWYTRPICM
jgi:hypothetical protein